jgi:2-polyprenyl-3-methyl-5-hydroxy-6-metoxy-1,4-benzoquinol methylase
MPPYASAIEIDVPCALAPVTAEQTDGAVRRLIAQVPLRSRVLDIGCGDGTVSRELATRRGARVTALDTDADLIERARMRTRASLGIEYCVADVLALSPRGFDVVIAVDVLRDLPRSAALSRLAAAVVPGGWVLIADELRSWLLGDLGRELRAALPGVSIRRHLGGRYSAMWQRPA